MCPQESLRVLRSDWAKCLPHRRPGIAWFEITGGDGLDRVFIQPRRRSGSAHRVLTRSGMSTRHGSDCSTAVGLTCTRSSTTFPDGFSRGMWPGPSIPALPHSFCLTHPRASHRESPCCWLTVDRLFEKSVMLGVDHAVKARVTCRLSPHWTVLSWCQDSLRRKNLFVYKSPC